MRTISLYTKPNYLSRKKTSLNAPSMCYWRSETREFFRDLFTPSSISSIGRYTSGCVPALNRFWLQHTDIPTTSQDSPFRSLRIRRSNVEGVVNIYAFGKKVRSFNVLESHHVWQLMVKWIWHYGRERQSDVRAWKGS